MFNADNVGRHKNHLLKLLIYTQRLGFVEFNIFLCIRFQLYPMYSKDQTIHQTPLTTFKSAQWTEALSLDNETIDNQHQKLFNIINELIKHADADVHSEILNETLYELLLYVDFHFSDEEEMLMKTNYPRLEEHKKIHRSFTKKIAMLCKDVVKGESNVTHNLITFLSEWLIQHIGVEDQDYKDFI